MKMGWRGRIIRAVIHELMRLHLREGRFSRRESAPENRALRISVRKTITYSSPGLE